MRLGKLGGLHLLPQGIGWRCSGMTESVDIYFLRRPSSWLLIFFHTIDTKSSSLLHIGITCVFARIAVLLIGQVRPDWRAASKAFLWLT